MIQTSKDIQIPVIVTPAKDTCTAFVPDLNVTIHGRDVVESLALCINYAGAIYFYNLERNSKLNLSTTYEAAEKLCKNRKSFVTYIGLSV